MHLNMNRRDPRVGRGDNSLVPVVPEMTTPIPAGI
jgi:hypothetical protein